LPSPGTNEGPIDDLGSAASFGGDRRSKIIKLAEEAAMAIADQIE
jgi:hypothetical protein